ncbi:PAS domain-containing sensor histidine kinase [Gimesia fumaroli]|uniref:histidine kinase n=1 Tax=Gimesia fumaroli TaxID=2527976 RepID=A0A518IF10_9PLAN|nr:PAS domain-containing protein [Gimesia fumaroli]QDV51674.1 Autoinducer 2 sensor kinase/phosphatase LuxQ [Gimesia fumaroli]
MSLNQSQEIQSDHSKHPVLIWASGLDQSHDFFNQAWLDFTESSVHENINAGWFQFIHPDDLPLFRLTYERALATQQPFQIEYRLKKHDGTYRWMQCHAVPRPDLDGDFSGLIATNTDIHDQLVKKSEQITYEENYELFLNCITEGIWDWIDVNSDEQWWSPHFYELLGYRDQELEASASTFKRLLHPDDLQGTLEAINQSLENEIPFGTAFRLRIKGGEYHWFRSTAKIIRDLNGNAVRMTGSISDIHRQILAEEALKETRRLAEQAQLEKETFLALMSQEVRTPLSAILGFSEILGESSDDPETQTVAETIHTNGQSLLDTINDFLDLSKLEEGMLDIEILDCCPVKVIENVHMHMAKKAELMDLKFDIASETEIPETIKSDPIRLKQILTTVIGTAIKLTKKGSVKLGVKTTAMANGTHQLTFRITNTGTELSLEQFSDLFTPYRLTDELMTHPVSGLGLGLAVSKHLTELLGGQIQVTDQDTSSTTVEISIPVGDISEVKMEKVSASKRLEEIKTYKASHDFLKQNCHILLVEDGIYNQRLINFLLTKAGAEITIVENGQHAIDELMKSREVGDPIGDPYDLILMDIQMPVLDGYSTTRKIRALGYTKPIIALTIHAMDSDRQKCFDAGCDEYMSKPLERKKLISIINSFLRKPQKQNLVAKEA